MTTTTGPRIVADRTRCVGAGQCVLAVERLFDQSDEDGTVIVLSDRPEPGEVDAVREAVRICPSGALSLAAEDG
ncbi:(4Fe-4S)-binding protein [Streptomyces sp. NPDC093085]|uniref:ferredoxin n=1 Tax=Streptomyces sp. NPDC093085 TaxID=3155068 RepID=UPI00341D3A7A